MRQPLWLLAPYRVQKTWNVHWVKAGGRENVSLILDDRDSVNWCLELIWSTRHHSMCFTILCQLISTTLWGSVIVILILQVKKLRTGRLKTLPQSHIHIVIGRERIPTQAKAKALCYWASFLLLVPYTSFHVKHRQQDIIHVSFTKSLSLHLTQASDMEAFTLRSI